MRLLFIIVMLVIWFLAVTMIFIQSTRKTYPGFGAWTLGHFVMAAGFLLLSLRGIIPDWLSVLGGNTCFPLAIVFYLKGTYRFLNQAPMPLWWYGFPLASLIGCAYFHLITDSLVNRSLIIALVVAIPNWAVAWLIIRSERKDPSLFYPVVSAVMFINGLIILIRAVWILFIPDFDIMSEAPIQYIYFISVIIFQIACSISFITLNSERMERDLYASELELKNSIDRLHAALEEVKTLGGLLPICANCKKIRDDSGYWHQLEEYISTHSHAEFSHGTCPECARKLYPELF